MIIKNSNTMLSADLDPNDNTPKIRSADAVMTYTTESISNYCNKKNNDGSVRLIVQHRVPSWSTQIKS